MKKKIIVSVISDVVTDQRVQKECNTLYKTGYDILLIGRKSKRNFGLEKLKYKVIRFSNPFRGGPAMYLVFNIQLFFYLLFKTADILWSNDLDTLLPNYLISRIKRYTLIYDSHEYFTLSVYKKTSREIWEKLEQFLFPRLKNVITVSDSIKNAYQAKYSVPVTVIRNVPYQYTKTDNKNLQLPSDKKILIIQGVGINENRGAEEAVLTIQFLPDHFNLYFIGTGTIWNKLKQLVSDLNLTDKVFFIDTLPFAEMMEYTSKSFLGLIFEKTGTTDHHLFALPNKFFDYINAGIPVLSSKAIEIEFLIKKYNVGDVITNFDPEKIAEKIITISENIDLYNQWKLNTAIASKELNWENEELKLITFMSNLE